MDKKAVVLVSGGLDSATTLAIAKNQGYKCYALSFDYGQKHITELSAAVRVSQALDIEHHKVITINVGEFGGSALTDSEIPVPEYSNSTEIPVTYVPARNTIFLSYALCWAEVIKARDIFIGVCAKDYSNYPDCRPEYIEAFTKMANLATKAGVSGMPFTIHTPLIASSKAETIKIGQKLGVDYSLTVSCYNADIIGAACGKCDSCTYRKKGFAEANIKDPTLYAS